MSLELGVAIAAGVALLVWIFWKVEVKVARKQAEHRVREYERRQEREKELREQERQRNMLYEDMTIDEAQQLVWAWEEMSEDERRDMPLERRVRFRKISEDLAAHRRKWDV